MKKEVILFGIFFLVLTFGLNGILAQDELSENERVSQAYDCLQSTIEEKTCDTMSLVEKIFAVLSLGECQEELIDDAKLNDEDEPECWPSGRCDIKLTAQAIWALNENGYNVDIAKQWLLDQKMIPNDLIWYLQIDSNEPIQCTLEYGQNSYDFSIGEDKIISEGTFGNCIGFDPTFRRYWFQIKDTCYEEEFSVSCDKTFLTTLLYREETSNTIHVLDKIESAPEGGSSDQKIEAYCFERQGQCDYLGGLWATTILSFLDEDISTFIPYILTTYEDHRTDFPEVFLYILTGGLQYRTRIADLQISGEYWRVGNNRFHDTALALLPFRGESFSPKETAIEWLLDVQQNDGCWAGGNIQDNGFLLYSIWPEIGPGEGGVIVDEDNSTSYDNDCEESGYFCMSSRKCSGNILNNFGGCISPQICCDEEYVEPTCEGDLGGTICSSDEYCVGREEYVAGLNIGEICCVEGNCEKKQIPEDEENTCLDNGGVCETYSCADGYIESEIYECTDNDVCCIQEETGMGYWWIWVLFVLIILVVVAIIYREKLKELYYKWKAKGGKNPSGTQQPKRPGYPPSPGYNRMPTRPPMQRKIVPPQQRRPVQRPQKNPRELDEVLKKLKNMGK
jgi:hypothetical protein